MNKPEKLSHIFRILDAVASIEASFKALSADCSQAANINPLRAGLTEMMQFLVVLSDECNVPMLKDATTEILMHVMNSESDREYHINRIFAEARKRGRDA